MSISWRYAGFLLWGPWMFDCEPTDSYSDISVRRSRTMDLMLVLQMNPSAGFLFWVPWTSFAQFDGDPVNGRWDTSVWIRVLRCLHYSKRCAEIPFPGSCTPLHSLINATVTTLVSAMRPHVWSQRSQSTCSGLNVWELPLIISW